VPKRNERNTLKVMKAMSLKLPADLRAWVAAEAQRSQASQSEVIRRSLERVRKQPAAKGVLSCADLAGDLVGSIEGPRDLSTNKSYLKEAVARGAKRGRKRPR
jgi:Arc/MetJ-type ribon-helix-helix transcriptional regulator